MGDEKTLAPGAPGIPPRWTSSAKSGVGTAYGLGSRVWYTISHGIIDEVYYPRVDQACIRDLGLIVTDGKDFFSEEKRHSRHETRPVAPGVPGYLMINTCTEGRYRIRKEVLADPSRDVVLQSIAFEPLIGSLEEYHLYVLLAPHLGNHGTGNTGWVGDYKGVPMLFAERQGTALALACSAPWLRRSAGYVGVSDGWQDVAAHKQMSWEFARAEDGNVALTGEVDLRSAGGSFVLALGFGRSEAEAGQRVLASLGSGYTACRSLFLAEWQQWQRSLLPLEQVEPEERALYRASTAVLRTHEDKRFRGGMIASLSIPWGFAKGDDDLGGYHLVWPRDLVEVAGGLLATGAKADVLRVLEYVQVTQEADGHWPQNMWLDGTPYWPGVQMDETAFPILLLDLAQREGVLDGKGEARFWPMCRRAASFLVCNGPVTQQDRWEEDPGYSPFTLAVEIAALVAAADLADRVGEPDVAGYLRETADAWNEGIERWTYVVGTDLATQLGIEGYYVRIAPPEAAEAPSPASGFVPIKNRPPDQSTEPAAHIISPDALALVRFGLRDPEDPRILATVQAIDSLLRVDTPSGPAWHRYNDDGYGEHSDGSPFDGTGMGRAWPLLTGERAHYELARGRTKEAGALLRTLAAFADEGGMIPEQVWDAPDIPEKELSFGRPSGSAMPLAWAHAEYVKLLRSLRDGRVFDMPPQTVRRYRQTNSRAEFAPWRFNLKCRSVAAGKALRIETLSPAVIHWSSDGWQTDADVSTRDTRLGVHVADLPTSGLAAGRTIRFSIYWSDERRWEGTDFAVEVLAAA
jgi:glucoamylase